MAMNADLDPTQPDPSDPEASEPQDPDELERLNAELRQQLRQERAERLADQHGLPPSYCELLADVPRDQQEAKALEFADELRAHVGAPVAGPGGQPVASSLPAEPSGPEPPTEPTGEPTAEDQLIGKVGEARHVGDLLGTQVAESRRAREPAPLEEAAVGGDVDEIRRAGSLDELMRLQQARRAPAD